MGSQGEGYHAATIQRRLAALDSSEWLPSPRSAEVVDLSSGAYHQNFLVCCEGKFSVARLNLSSQWGLTKRNQLEREAKVLRAVEGSGVTPEFVALLDGDPPILVETFIDGHEFCYGAATDSVAQALAAVHTYTAGRGDWLPPTEPVSFLFDDGSRLLASMSLEDRGLAEAARLLVGCQDARSSAAPLRASSDVVVHTDLIHSNILERADGCRIIDWEGARRGPAEWDLAYFLSPVTLRWAPEQAVQMSRLEVDRFIQTYARAVGLAADSITESIHALMPAVVFRSLAWCVAKASEAPPVGGSVLADIASLAYIESLMHIFE